MYSPNALTHPVEEDVDKIVVEKKQYGKDTYGPEADGGAYNYKGQHVSQQGYVDKEKVEDDYEEVKESGPYESKKEIIQKEIVKETKIGHGHKNIGNIGYGSPGPVEIPNKSFEKKEFIKQELDVQNDKEYSQQGGQEGYEGVKEEKWSNNKVPAGLDLGPGSEAAYEAGKGGSSGYGGQFAKKEIIKESSYEDKDGGGSWGRNKESGLGLDQGKNYGFESENIGAGIYGGPTGKGVGKQIGGYGGKRIKEEEIIEKEIGYGNSGGYEKQAELGGEGGYENKNIKEEIIKEDAIIGGKREWAANNKYGPEQPIPKVPESSWAKGPENVEFKEEAQEILKNIGNQGYGGPSPAVIGQKGYEKKEFIKKEFEVQNDKDYKQAQGGYGGSAGYGGGFGGQQGYGNVKETEVKVIEKGYEGEGKYNKVSTIGPLRPC